ncbi:MAG: single-stranded-DNA-specific exonuclease RecJ [Anaerolineaceae bacterium 4572_32.2]|nr:MAG: single-stranded-DNA-specific exonuclease RecJ [Anaerolineaceae bacterium 4572_32.2]
MSMSDWIEPLAVKAPEALRIAVGGHPLVAETLARRGFTEVEAARAFLDPDLYQPAPPTDLPNIVTAAERLERAIRQGEHICVWGDFDVDGQTATTILVSTLRDLGAAAQYYIPNRQEGGHGVHIPILKRLIGDGVELVLTCDTGVTAHKAIAYAQTQGVGVIVTDHHDLPPTLPDAYAVTDPKLLPDDHPLRELPGVGVAYKLAELLYERAGRTGEAAQYLDLVALGIVADVATQIGDTRYLLQRGLEVLRRTERTGLQALIEVAELDPARITGEHIGFQLAPRLNSLGRLADAAVAVEFLTTGDLARARILAAEMDGLNVQRKLLCDQVFQGAQAQIERDPSLLEYRALVLSHPDWPAGIVGIVAGRLAERYNRPTILIAAPPGELGRGSARSIAGCDINAAIAAQGDMLHGFGGHPMAAGLSIDPERIPEFRRALSRDPDGFLKPLGPKTLPIDGYLPLADLSLDLVEQLERLAPFGPGNRALTLASRGLTLKSHTTIGRTQEHLRLVVEDEAGATQKVLWWRGAGERLPADRFDLAYTVRASDYRGRQEVQVVWVEQRATSGKRQATSGKRQVASGELQVVDYRGKAHPHALLERLREQEKDVQVWSEAGDRAEVAGRDRRELGQAKTLVIWTTPPGPAELQSALEAVSPETAYLFGIEPGLDRLDTFLKRLIGLTKQILNSNNGLASVSMLAAATAQREMTVRAGLAWLEAQGHLAAQSAGDDVHLMVGGQKPDDKLPQVTAQLKELLKETAAYRAHFARADKETLIQL